MTTIVEQLSAYAAALRYEDLPREVVEQAKRLIIDTLGCALGGYAGEPAVIARELAGTVTSTTPARSWSAASARASISRRLPTA